MNARAVERDRTTGAVSWHHLDGDRYLIVGETTSGRRFRMVFDRWASARFVNLYRGRRYLLRDGRRYLLQTISN